MSLMKLFGGAFSPGARPLRSALFALLAAGLVQAAFPGQARADDDEDDAATEEPADADDSGVADTDPSSVVIYRGKLAPYGQWVDHPVYGTVWVPNSAVVGPDFAPYVSSGHWALTDDADWLWVSDYDWGYIPFHYGRWVWVSDVGWAWIPGRTYANAWVVWRVGAGGYIGWAPMPPAYYWSDGYAVAIWAVPPAPFIFVHTRYCFDHHVHTYVVHDRNEVHTAAQGTHHYHSGHASSHHVAASPTLAEAGVGPKDAPKMRSKPDPRSLELQHSDKDRPSKGRSGAALSKPAAGGPHAGDASASKLGGSRAGVGRSSTANTASGSTKRARRVAPIVGQRVEAARGESHVTSSSRPATKPSLGRPTSRPSVDGASIPHPSPSIPRAQPSTVQPIKKRPIPAATGAVPTRRAAPKASGHKH